jgi:hypothetical protein
MARVIALLEIALFLWLVSDISSSLGRLGEGLPLALLPLPPPKAAAWLRNLAAA